MPWQQPLRKMDNAMCFAPSVLVLLEAGEQRMMNKRHLCKWNMNMDPMLTFVFLTQNQNPISTNEKVLKARTQATQLEHSSPQLPALTILWSLVRRRRLPAIWGPDAGSAFEVYYGSTLAL